MGTFPGVDGLRGFFLTPHRGARGYQKGEKGKRVKGKKGKRGKGKKGKREKGQQGTSGPSKRAKQTIQR